jgi:CHASE2 domain-containing sensor protein
MNGLLAKFRAALIQKQNYRQISKVNNLLSVILLSSLGVTALIAGISELKWLEIGELSIYDRMLRSRTPEPIDDRILLVNITQEDLNQQQWPLSETTINQLIGKLQSYQPRVIGLNIYLHQHKKLALNLEKNNIIGTCLLSNIGRSEIAPPANLPIDNIGFNDVVTDNSVDQVLRRGLLISDYENQDQKCQTPFSFPFLLAITYLEKQGIKYSFTADKQLKIGNTIFPRLDADGGSYQNTDADGYQIIINYRHPNQLVKQVTLTQILTNQINPNWIQDRLIIIGTTAPDIHSGYYTPYSSLSDQPVRTPRVLIHAQIASQIISTVLDGRPLIYYWPNWVEFLWVWVSALVGAILAWQWRHPLALIIVEIFILLGIVGIAVGLYIQGIWIPLLTPWLALVISSFVVMGYTSYKTQKQNQAILAQAQQREEAISQLNLLLEEKRDAQRDNQIDNTIADNIDDSTQLPSDFNDFNFTEISAFKNDARLLGGRFKINESLASGGFGCTYLAEDTQKNGNPTCVVKQLMPARRDTRFLEVARRLFNTEGEILSLLGKHPYIPELLASFEENQEFYLVQEYIQGQTLSAELPPHTQIKSEKYVVQMLQEILEILVFIHSHKVIHRDIKPSNIIRCEQNHHLVLIDFGAVKLIQPRSNGETEMATVAIGTKGYAPPEQFAGHPRFASDIYALGMIAIQALTGSLPSELHAHPDTGNIMWQKNSNVSDQLAVILDRMICYNFSDRYQSANAIIKDLKTLIISP